MTNSQARKLLAADARTSLGNISLVVDRAPGDSQRPVVLMLHGLLREASLLTGWYDIVPPGVDLVIADFPGHGRSPGQGKATVEAMAQRIREVISTHFAGRSVIIVGESLGGLVGLALGDGSLPEIKGIVATDPPLSTSKQWPIFVNFLMHAQSFPASDYRRVLFSDLFGFDDETHVREVLYYDMVRNVRVPVLILVGDIPLLPGWPLAPRKGVPSVIDDVDRYVVSLIGNDRVRLETIRNKGHILLDRSDQATQKTILDFCHSTLSGAEPARDTARPVAGYSDTLVWR